MMTRLIIWLLLLATWMPINGIWQVASYAGPLFVLLLALLLGVVGLSQFDLFVWLLAGAAAFLASAFYRDTGLWHTALGLFTYSSLLLFTVRFRSAHLARVTFINAVVFLSLFEGFLGISQLVLQEGGLQFRSSLAAGDAVVGTLGTNAHLFAVKMLFQSLFLFYAWQALRHERPSRLLHPYLIAAAALVGLFSALLASALISTILFMATVVLVSIDWRRLFAMLMTLQIRRGWLLLGLLVVVGGAFFMATQQGNARLINRNLNRLITEGPQSNPIAFQKIITLEQSIREVLLADGPTALFGLGLGRYSSRAAMILSGGYLRQQPDLIPISRSPETDKYIYALWNPDTWHKYGGSIMGMPTSSVQAVLVEFGLVGTLFLVWYFWLLLRRARRRTRLAGNDLQRVFGRSVTPFIVALGAISLTDLWLEYAQLTTFIYLVIVLALSGGTQKFTRTLTPDAAQSPGNEPPQPC